MKSKKEVLENSIAEKMDRLKTLRFKTQNREATVQERREMQFHLDSIDDLEEELHVESQIIRTEIRGGSNMPENNSSKFVNFGDQLTAIRNAGIPGQATDPRLFEVRAPSGLNEGVNSEGGFLVQTDFAKDILGTLWDTQVMLSRLRRIGISGNSNGITLNGFDETSRADGSRSGGVQSAWTGEAVLNADSKPKFRQIEMKLNKLTGLCYATDELAADAGALEAAIGQAFKDELEFRIVDSVINGTGVGQPLGILSSGCLTTVDAVGGQGADTIMFENIVAMWSRMIPSSRSKAVWLINSDILPQLFTMSLSVGTGGVPVYQPANGAAGQPFNTLLGQPVIAIEQCQTLGDVGDIILADLSNYIFIHKGGLKTDMSIHLRFAYSEQAFRFVYRCDGQPVLGSEITPANGTNTMSHFVTLAAR